MWLPSRARRTARAQRESDALKIQRTHAANEPPEAALGESLGFKSVGKVGDTHAGAAFQGRCHVARTATARLVAIKEDDDLAGDGQQLGLGVGDFAAHGGNDVLEPGLVELHHGEEALDNDETLLHHLRSRAMVVVEFPVLSEALGELVLAVLVHVRGLEASTRIGDELAFRVVNGYGNHAAENPHRAVADAEVLNGRLCELPILREVRMPRLQVQLQVEGGVAVRLGLLVVVSRCWRVTPF